MFCRVRPLLPDDGVGTDASVISYPTSVETLGRGIDVIQSGMDVLFLFCLSLIEFNLNRRVLLKYSFFLLINAYFTVNRAKDSFHI